MPWDLPIAVLSGFENPITDWVIDTNQTDLNLYDYTGNQPEVLEYNITVNSGVDIDTMEFGPFPAGCIINFTMNGRIRGRGGSGGQGGWADFADPAAAPSLGNGTPPTDGETALVLAPAITVRLDMDDGNIWGGGGGGAGGRSVSSVALFASAGGGGGGGRGWDLNPGGAGGVVTGRNPDPDPANGDPGTDGSAALVGFGGDTTEDAEVTGSPGGDGGQWGEAGNPEPFPPTPFTLDGATNVSGAAVTPGAAGNAIDINGATLQFVGAKGEVTLVSEGRLRGPVT